MALNLQVENAVSTTAQSVKDQNGNTSSLTLSTDNLGIGTTNPASKLHVVGPGGGAVVVSIEQPAGSMNFVDLKSFQGGGNYGSDIRFVDSGVVNGEIKSTANSQLRFATSRVDRVTIDSNGNVGIGTANPDATLHVSSGSDFNSPQVEITQTTPSDFARLRFFSFGTDPDDPSHPRPFPLWDIAAGQGVLNLFVQGTGNVMTLKSEGKVGIRTEQPQTELHVNGTATVGVLQITGGGDLAEPFSVEENTDAEPGTVMVIDEENPGKLKISDNANDRKVAGIVSGAGGMNPGVMMQQDDMLAAKTHVALVGRVYCKAEAISSPIEPGDLLTTSDIPGHAMKARDEQAARGAILGKAMSSHREGKGLVLVLVNLQ